MERFPAKTSLAGSRSVSEELGVGRSSPARKTKIKISGSTQTGGNTNQEYFGSPHRSTSAASGSPRLLSETTKERLLASQRLSPQISTNSKSRTKRQSRERPALPQMMSLNNEYLSDSSDSIYCEAPRQITTRHQNTKGWYNHHFNVDKSREQCQNEGKKCNYGKWKNA